MLLPTLTAWGFEMTVKLLRDWTVITSFERDGNRLITMTAPGGAMAFLWFSENNKDLVVLEDGSYPHGFIQVGYPSSALQLSYEDAVAINKELK